MLTLTLPQARKMVKPLRRKEPTPPFTGELAPHTEGCAERTQGMDWETALRYREAMLRTDFRDIALVASRGQFYLRFTRPVRSGNVVESMRETRLQRGVLQFDEMAFVPMDARSPEGWHYTTHFYPDGSAAPVYSTHCEQGCTCPDYTYRQNITDGLCKHQAALAIFLGRNILAEKMAALERLREGAGMVSLNATAAERRAWVQGNIGKDFD